MFWKGGFSAMEEWLQIDKDSTRETVSEIVREAIAIIQMRCGDGDEEKWVNFSSVSQGNRWDLLMDQKQGGSKREKSKIVVPFTEKWKTGVGSGQGSGDDIQSSALGMGTVRNGDVGR